MCLGIPGLITQINPPEHGLVMGRVNFGGLEREVCLGYTPEAKLGDYVLVHVGFALSVLDPEAAQQLLADLAEIERLGELGPGQSDDDSAQVPPSSAQRGGGAQSP
jgi:hydrogenase expression/formation protein HypC